jgi:anhydro-N-acetylmuramic acid kinase
MSADDRSLALGLMSGTSADGVSAALGSFRGRTFQCEGFLNQPYPDDLRALLRHPATLSAAAVSQLNVRIGELFAKAALHLLKKLNVRAGDVACIGSHGQTIYHGPDDPFPNTFQIGDPAVIAQRTGIPGVSHIRPADKAPRGPGAPRNPIFYNNL